jgi:phytoene dehydrogenase-like protein
MHLHLGFDASGLDKLEMHHIVVNSWEGGVDTEQNVVLISIPSVADPNMAPAGKHCLHAYLPATETFSLWKGNGLSAQPMKHVSCIILKLKNLTT